MEIIFYKEHMAINEIYHMLLLFHFFQHTVMSLSCRRLMELPQFKPFGLYIKLILDPIFHTEFGHIFDVSEPHISCY